MVKDVQDKVLLTAYVGLGAVLGEILFGLAWGKILSWPFDTIFFAGFVLYLLWIAGYASGAFVRVRQWYTNRRDRMFFARRLSVVIQKRVGTVLNGLQVITSGEGSIDKVAQKFFERPATFTTPTTGHPLLADTIPDFYQVIDILVGDQRTLEISFRHLGDLKKDAMRETSICLSDLGYSIDRRVAWIETVVKACANHKATCPQVAYANAAAQYARLQQNYLDLVAAHDSLFDAFNDAACADPSAYSSSKLSKRALDPFP